MHSLIWKNTSKICKGGSKCPLEGFCPNPGGAKLNYPQNERNKEKKKKEAKYLIIKHAGQNGRIKIRYPEI